MSNKNFGISGKGYYIALILCAAAIGISGYLYYQNAHKVQEVSVQEPMVQEAAVRRETVPAQEPETTAPPSSEAPSVPRPTAPAVEPSAAASEEPEKRVLKTAAPVDGDTIGHYAMDCLSYNETTRDWRVHNGVDLSAEEGAEVHAAAEGTVYTAYQDDAMGYTVVIRHEGGYTTRYSNLASELCVSPGDTVTLGQTIGRVGNTALLETAMGSHVHFSVSFQDAPMSPEDFLALG